MFKAHEISDSLGFEYSRLGNWKRERKMKGLFIPSTATFRGDKREDGVK